MGEYDTIIAKLPKPYSTEEQYLYSIVCAAAKVNYQAPYLNPFWRKEKYLKALWQIAEERINEPVIPSDNTVTTEKIKDASVTEGKLSTSVSAKLLDDGRVTAQMLADGSVIEAKLLDGSVSTKKISNGAVTEAKLDALVEAKLLADGRVLTSMIADLAITVAKIADKSVSKNKLADDVMESLLPINHVGVVPQGVIGQITETGAALTVDILKAKLNEIIMALSSSGVMEEK